MATIAIGDIHGNIAALNLVVGLVEDEVRSGDTVVFLGDYIDRGEHTSQCIERILRFRAESPAEVVGLMGNHEDWLLQSWRDATEHTWLLATSAFKTMLSYSPEAALEISRRAKAAGRALYESCVPLPYHLFFEAMPAAHLEFLQSLRLYHRTTDAVCVHGGLDPGLGPVEHQPERSLVWGTDDFQHRYQGDPVIVYGHWSNALPCADGRAEPLVIGRTIGIDSIEHGTLTALKMPDGVVMQSNGCSTWIYSSIGIRQRAAQPNAGAQGPPQARGRVCRRARRSRAGGVGASPGGGQSRYTRTE